MRKHNRGDTLVEVALAVGIFSLVAIAVVSVVSITASSAQSALEVTLTREEIDAQAEALRFIHSSYVAGGADNASTLNRKYASLWKAIADKANDADRDGLINFLNNNIGDCSAAYSSLNGYKAFIINIRKIGEIDANSGENWQPSSAIANEIVKQYNGSIFTTATTYPHIIYTNGTSVSGENEILNNDNKLLQDYYNSIYRAEGIYIIAVKDNNTTSIIGSSSVDSKSSAYYDFYIRTCWYAPGAEKPSTISTVIRLVDPNKVDY